MLPTVELSDHVFVNKLAYGIRLPLGAHYVTHFDGPARGDVVVLDAPDSGIVLLKRVVGLPGDRVEVHGARILVNGAAVPLEDHGDYAYETLGSSRHTLDLDDGSGPDYGPRTLPAGRYLVLGDHRGNSRDGRFFGLVERDAILGRRPLARRRLHVEASLNTARRVGQISRFLTFSALSSMNWRRGST
jgi:signal peptidase I